MKHSFEVTLVLVAMFAVAQVMGLFVVDQYRETEISESGEVNTNWESLPSVGGVEFERPNIEPEQSIWLISIGIVIGTVMLLFLVRMKHDIIWKVWFFLAVTLCLTAALGAFINNIAAFIISALLAYIKIYKKSFLVHNSTELLIYGGLAAIFVPILNVGSAAMLLILISIYDMYAVWKSKHMITLAKFQTESGIFAGMLVPYSFPLPKKSSAKKKTKLAKVKTAILGGGDIGFPLIFAGTVMVAKGMLLAMFIPAFATISLFMLLWLGKKDRFYPAMPFITTGCFAGFGAMSIASFILAFV